MTIGESATSRDVRCQMSGVRCSPEASVSSPGAGGGPKGRRGQPGSTDAVPPSRLRRTPPSGGETDQVTFPHSGGGERFLPRREVARPDDICEQDGSSGSPFVTPATTSQPAAATSQRSRCSRRQALQGRGRSMRRWSEWRSPRFRWVSCGQSTGPCPPLPIAVLWDRIHAPPREGAPTSRRCRPSPGTAHSPPGSRR